MKALFLILGLCPLLSAAQTEGIKFESNLSWNDIIIKAKKENKYIFVDCYTTWCAPCRYMSQNIFVQKSIGDFFNSNFISVSVQMDRTVKDSSSVRAWYADADSIGVKYGVNVYPTYLIFSPEGKVLDRFIGSYEERAFIKRATDALNPEKQYYNLVNNLNDHLNDSVFLRNALSLAEQANDNLNAIRIADYYLGSLHGQLTIEDINLLTRLNVPSSSKVFNFLLTNAPQIDKMLNTKNQIIENKLAHCIRDEQVQPLFNNDDSKVDYMLVLHNLQVKYPSLTNVLPFWVKGCFKHNIEKSVNSSIYKKGTSKMNWKAISRKMRLQYPGYDCIRLVDEIKPEYYEFKKMWLQCEQSALALFARYGDQLGAGEINKIVWYYLFMYSSNPKTLSIALRWSKRSIDLAPDHCEFIDTYANLLYKTGDRAKALEWENKAIEKCGGSNDEIRSNFEKMQRGERTWTDINPKKI